MIKWTKNEITGLTRGGKELVESHDHQTPK